MLQACRLVLGLQHERQVQRARAHLNADALDFPVALPATTVATATTTDLVLVLLGDLALPQPPPISVHVRRSAIEDCDPPPT